VAIGSNPKSRQPAFGVFSWRIGCLRPGPGEVPLSAVKRVEVLTDGASALYGADAIAGVINFILKKNHQGLTLDAGYVQPEHAGGKSANASVTYGFGDLESNGYHVLMSYRHDEQEQLKAPQRRFAATSYIPFSNDGVNYIYDRTSTSTVPVNATVSFTDPKTNKAIGFNPFYKANGKCADLNVPYLSNDAQTEFCSFDFAATVEIIPESKRDTFFRRSEVVVPAGADQHRAFAQPRHGLGPDRGREVLVRQVHVLDHLLSGQVRHLQAVECAPGH
jgi:outer membrane receptor protein involved in Fe transport